MYAVIEDSGSQIYVREGDVIKVDIRDLADNATSLTFDKVLLVAGEDRETAIGQPYVEGASVTADIIKEGRTPKVDVVKFKRRKDYLRRKGHRQSFIQVKVTGIKA